MEPPQPLRWHSQGCSVRRDTHSPLRAIPVVAATPTTTPAARSRAVTPAADHATGDAGGGYARGAAGGGYATGNAGGAWFAEACANAQENGDPAPIGCAS